MKKTRVTKIRHVRKKRKRNWRKIFHNFVYQWREFFDHSTFVGLRLIDGTRIKSKIWSIIYLIFWITCVVYSFWRCQSVLKLYHFDQLKTTIGYNEMLELRFPAISFCNMNTFRRSAIGSNEMLIVFISAIYGGQIEDEFRRRHLQNQKLCRNPSNKGERVGDVLEFIDQMKNGISSNFFKQNAIDSNLTVKRCWWNKAEISCDQYFYNLFLDNRLCFSFNQDVGTLLKAKNAFAKIGYGAENTKVRALNKYGPNTGLQLLLDFQQKEYCGIQQENCYYGAGLNVFIHDPEHLVSFELDSHLLLSPGFVYDITVRLVKSILNTERLGRCRTTVDSYLSGTSIYQRQDCFTNCLIELIVKRCRCIIPGVDTYTLARYSTVPISRMPQCSEHINTVNCLKQVTSAYYREGPNSFCPKCKRSCIETAYEYTVSSKRFSKLTLNHLMKNYSTTRDVNDVKKNYALGKFYFQEMIEMTIVEDFKFTTYDLFSYIGASLSLFLGISVVSMYEILHQILYSTLTFCVNVKREKIESIVDEIDMADKRQHTSRQRASRETAVIESAGPSAKKSSNASQHIKSKKFRGAVKFVENEVVFVKPIITNPAGVKMDCEANSANSEVVVADIHSQNHPLTNPDVYETQALGHGTLICTEVGTQPQDEHSAEIDGEIDSKV